jgi:chromosome segregation ATPase
MRDTLIADSADIKFECSQCGQRMVVERSAAGLMADCPACCTPVTVPHGHSSAESGESELLTQESVAAVRSHRNSGRDAAHQVEVDLAEAQAEIARQHALFKKAVDECERLKANATHIQAELKSFQADRQQLKADVAQARQVVGAAEARASELADTLSATQHENESLRYQAQADVNALHGLISALEAKIGERENQLREGKAETTEALRSLAKSRAEFNRLNTEAAGLRSEVEILRHDFESTTQELGATSQQLFETKGQLEPLIEEHRGTTAERDSWREQAEGFRRDLAALDTGRDLLELRAQHAELQRKHESLEVTLVEQTETAKKENDVLRGIVDRQNATLGTHHKELRRLRRGRFAVRFVYGLFALGLLALGYLAVHIFAPQHLTKLLGH